MGGSNVSSGTGAFDISGILGYVTLGLLGAFLLALIGGMLFGMARGAKRSAKRLVILLLFFILAFVITPLISGILVDSFLGKFISDFINKSIDGNEVVNSALSNLSDINSFVVGLPLVVINIVVFWVLLFLFRYIFSPIFSGIFLRGIAPKRDQDGNKIKSSKWGGLAIGALQGAIVFLVVFIPVTGLMSSLNRIDTYEPKLETVNVDVTNPSSDLEFLGDLNKGIRDINKEIQESPIGIISKFSGMQAVGDFGLGYFMTVKAGDTRVNVKHEIEVVSELSRDAIAIYQIFDSVEDGNKLIGLFNNSNDVEYMRSVIDKVFKMGLVELALDSEFGSFVNEAGLLDEVPLDGIVEDQDAYSNSIYTSMGKLNADFLREDFQSILKLAQLVISEHTITEAGRQSSVSLYRDLDNLFYTLGRDNVSAVNPISVAGDTFPTKSAAIEHVFDMLGNTLTEVKITTGTGTSAVTRNLSEQIFNYIGNLNMFKSLLMDKDNPQLHSMPLAKLLGVSPSEAEIKDFDQVMDGLANIVIRVVKIGPTVIKLADSGGDLVAVADILSENNGAAITEVGKILEILTNNGDANGFISDGQTKVMGTGNILRKAISDLILKSAKSSGTDGVINFNKMINTLAAKLSPNGPEIIWADELKVIVDVVEELGSLLSGDLDADAIMNKILSGELIDSIAGSDMIADMVVDILDGAINDALSESGVQFDFGEAKSSEVVEALGAILTQLTGSDPNLNISSLIENIGNEGFSDVGDIVDLFGGKDGGEDNAIVLLAESGVKIVIEDAVTAGALQDSITDYITTLDPVVDAELIRILSAANGLFVFPPVLP